MADDNVTQSGAEDRAAPWIARVVGLCLASAVVLGLLALALWRALDLGDVEMSLEHVEALIRSWGMWSAAGSIVIMILHSFVPLPAEIIAMANGMVFGGFWGFWGIFFAIPLATLVQAVLTAWPSFPDDTEPAEVIATPGALATHRDENHAEQQESKRA